MRKIAAYIGSLTAIGSNTILKIHNTKHTTGFDGKQWQLSLSGLSWWNINWPGNNCVFETKFYSCVPRYRLRSLPAWWRVQPSGRTCPRVTVTTWWCWWLRWWLWQTSASSCWPCLSPYQRRWDSTPGEHLSPGSRQTPSRWVLQYSMPCYTMLCVNEICLGYTIRTDTLVGYLASSASVAILKSLWCLC